MKDSQINERKTQSDIERVNRLYDESQIEGRINESLAKIEQRQANLQKRLSELDSQISKISAISAVEAKVSNLQKRLDDFISSADGSSKVDAKVANLQKRLDEIESSPAKVQQDKALEARVKALESRKNVDIIREEIDADAFLEKLGGKMPRENDIKELDRIYGKEIDRLDKKLDALAKKK